MTNKEALEYTVAIQATSGLLEKALLDAKPSPINPLEVYVPANELPIALCAVEVLMTVKAFKTISEGSMTITVDKDAVNERLLYLARKHNLLELLSTEGKPYVHNRTNIW